jgi:hypothetical protein
MGLISKVVITKWSNSTKNYYIKKGYLFTKIGDEFKVKVEDLMHGSGVYVDVQCDCEYCEEKIISVIYSNYTKYVKNDGRYYCIKCSSRLFGKNKRIKKQLFKSKSFEQWCIDNNRQDVLDRWDYELNNHKSSEVTYRSGQKYYFKCPIGLHKSELKSIDRFVSGKEGSIQCNQCNSFAQYLIDLYGEKALELYWDYDKNRNINPWNISKSCAKPNVFIRCQEKDYHNSYKTIPNSFIQGVRCPYCCNYHGKVHPKDSLGQYIIDNFGEEFLEKAWSEKNKKSVFEYSPKAHINTWWKCPDNKHKDFKRKTESSNELDFRCPECSEESNESSLQRKTRLYLNELGFKTLHEYNCTIIAQNPKIKNKLGRMPYDNEIVKLKLIIEIHGQQHYQITSWHKKLAKKHNTTPEYELHYQKLKDRYKRIFAKSQGYFYLEIPYWMDNKNEDWKQLIDGKIKELNKAGDMA